MHSPSPVVDHSCSPRGNVRDAAGAARALLAPTGGAQLDALEDGAQDSLELDRGEACADATPLAAAERDEPVGRRALQEPLRPEALRVGVETFGENCTPRVETARNVPAGRRHPPSRSGALNLSDTESTTGRHRRVSLTTAVRYSSLPSTLASRQRASTSGWRSTRSKHHASAAAVVSYPAPSRVRTWSSNSWSSARGCPHRGRRQRTSGGIPRPGTPPLSGLRSPHAGGVARLGCRHPYLEVGRG
jgi:hypothetical protein